MPIRQKHSFIIFSITAFLSIGCTQKAEFAESSDGLPLGVGGLEAGDGIGGGSNIDDDLPTIVDFFEDEDSEVSEPEVGLQGKIYYFLNASGSPELPDFVEDKSGNNIAFPEDLNSADQIIQNGYQLPANIRLTHLFIPTVSFREGFKGPQGTIKDVLGNPLIEAFAVDVKGYLQLAEGMESGNYEIAVLSDDGSILLADLDDSGAVDDILVDNDGTHSTSLGCSATTIEMSASRQLPLRLKYFQGPREHIALNLLMRKLGPGEAAGNDPLCGFASNEDWFNFTTNANYVPDLVNSKYGELVGRGWFRPSSAMLRNQ